MALRDSAGETVRYVEAHVVTGRKWRPGEEVQKATTRGRAGLGWGDLPMRWSRTNRKERKDLVVSEVIKMAEEEYRVKAEAQGQQGRWTTWELWVMG